MVQPAAAIKLVYLYFILFICVVPIIIILGNGDYSYDDDDRSWPNEPRVWYLNFFLSTVTGNVIFALFTEGGSSSNSSSGIIIMLVCRYYESL